jgi:hypothetical protein
MRFSRDRTILRQILRSALVMALTAAAAGCDSQAGRDARDSTLGVFNVLLGSDEDPNSLQVDPGAPPPAVAARCPPVVIREGTETYRLYERGHENDPQHVVYQAGITKVARECEFIEPNAVRINFGVAGRVIAGPAWNAGEIKMPLRAAFVKTGGQAVWTQSYTLNPLMVPGDTITQFIEVEQDLFYEFPDGEHINDFVIYVGFDDYGAKGRPS